MIVEDIDVKGIHIKKVIISLYELVCLVLIAVVLVNRTNLL